MVVVVVVVVDQVVDQGDYDLFVVGNAVDAVAVFA